MSNLLGKADLHIHSHYSPDSSTSIEEILTQALKANLDIIAITDHNTIEGAIKTQAMAVNLKIEVIIGEEITTQQGHLIGLFLKKRIKPGQSIEETIKEIHHQQGLVIVPHPFVLIAESVSIKTLLKIKDQIDGIEIVNVKFDKLNRFRIKRFEKYLQSLAKIGSSDSHIKESIGTGLTLFSGTTNQDLIIAIKNKTTIAKKIPSSKIYITEALEIYKRNKYQPKFYLKLIKVLFLLLLMKIENICFLIFEKLKKILFKKDH